MYKYLELEVKEQIGIITINRPESMNALNKEVIDELDQLFTNEEFLSKVNVLIIHGKGRAFVAGADINEMVNMSEEEAIQFSIFGQETFMKIEECDLPVIAAVNGFALGGGLELAMACDIRIASDKAKFGQPEVTLGVIPGFSGTQRLARLVGTSKAKELIFTGKMINATEALAIGLVNNVIEGDILFEDVYKMAKQISNNAPKAVRFAKKAIDDGIENQLVDGNDIEANYFGKCFTTDDQKNGMNGFLNKKAVTFTGK